MRSKRTDNNMKDRVIKKITDEVSLSKDQEKILRSSEKWRVKTVDFAKNIFHDYRNFLTKRTGKDVVVAGNTTR